MFHINIAYCLFSLVLVKHITPKNIPVYVKTSSTSAKTT